MSKDQWSPLQRNQAVLLWGPQFALGMQRFQGLHQIFACQRRLNDVVDQPSACCQIRISKRLAIRFNELLAFARLIFRGIDFLAEDDSGSCPSAFITGLRCRPRDYSVRLRSLPHIAR